MPRSALRYFCTICDTEYVTYEEAEMCEALPTPARDFNEGDMISFEATVVSYGAYCGEWRTGKVLLAFLRLCQDPQGNKVHDWGYIVHVNGVVARECFVTKSYSDSGQPIFLSPLGGEFPVGYAEELRKKYLLERGS